MPSEGRTSASQSKPAKMGSCLALRKAASVYVRAKYVRRGEKTYGPYWQVVKAYRTHDGKPKQRVIANVGKAEDGAMADSLARMQGILCGSKECPDLATMWLEQPNGKRVTTRLVNRQVGFRVCATHFDAWKNRTLGGCVPAYLYRGK